MASANQEEALPWKIDLQTIASPAVREKSLQIGENTPGWADDIRKCLETSDLPPSREEVRKVKSRATRFTMVDGVLYRRGFFKSIIKMCNKGGGRIRYKRNTRGDMRKSFGRTITSCKYCKAGYYWPNTLKDAKEFVNTPIKELRSITSPWSFA